VEPFVPHDQEYYLSIVSDRLGCTISFSECGGIEIEENWDKVLPFFFFCASFLVLLHYLFRLTSVVFSWGTWFSGINR
jgi:hypothetical protein